MQNKLSSDVPYAPAEDTYFLEDNLVNEKGKWALDIGTGSGYLTKILSRNFLQVIATDIDYNSLINQNHKFENCICCDAADALNCKFDLIVCNMPYLQSDSIIDIRVDGGKEGIEIPLKIIKSAIKCLDENGKILFITSSLSNYQKLLEKSRDLNLVVHIVTRKKLFFEELILVEAKKN